MGKNQQSICVHEIWKIPTNSKRRDSLVKNRPETAQKKIPTAFTLFSYQGGANQKHNALLYHTAPPPMAHRKADGIKVSAGGAAGAGSAGAGGQWLQTGSATFISTQAYPTHVSVMNVLCNTTATTKNLF